MKNDECLKPGEVSKNETAAPVEASSMFDNLEQQQKKAEEKLAEEKKKEPENICVVAEKAEKGILDFIEDIQGQLNNITSTYLLQSTFNSYIPSSITTTPVTSGTSHYLALTWSGSGQPINTNSNLRYNATTNTLSVPNIIGNVSGVATTATYVTATQIVGGSDYFVPFCYSGSSASLYTYTGLRFDTIYSTLSTAFFQGNLIGVAQSIKIALNNNHQDDYLTFTSDSNLKLRL
jgi:hypothetical protein